jgi:hypothetical protein
VRRVSGAIATALAAGSALAGCALAGCGTAQGPAPGIAGEFIRSGGPGGTPNIPLPGQVVAVSSAGERYSVTAGPDGRFSLSLPAGTYHVAGYSPLVEDGQGGCAIRKPVHVAAGRTTRGVLVGCSIK